MNAESTDEGLVSREHSNNTVSIEAEQKGQEADGSKQAAARTVECRLNLSA
jgi:hypothetical protein